MAEPVVETQKLTKIFLDFWGRKKKVALRALDIKVNQAAAWPVVPHRGASNRDGQIDHRCAQKRVDRLSA